jgi:hypothetical protein
MTTPAPRGHWLDTRGPLLSAILALAVLVPAAVLFAQVWSDAGDKVTYAQKERHGIAYLQALGPVATALTDAQSSAVAGVSVNTSRLRQAVDAATTADQRYGGELRTHQRWTELSSRIGALSGQHAATPAATYSGYSQVTALLLALYDKVRNESGLIRDPDADVYYLEDGAAQELPEGVVAAGQYGDLIVIALGESGTARDNTVGDIIQTRASLASNASDLTDDLSLAVDATASRTLSSDLLARLDRFRRSIDALAPGTIATQDTVGTADEDRVSSNRGATESSAADLSSAVLKAIDGLIVTRLNGLAGRQHLALGLLLAAALLALGPAALLGAARLRAQLAANRARAERTGPDEPPASAVPPPGSGRLGAALAGRQGPEPPGGGQPADRWSADAGLDQRPADWERSGAAR